MIHQTLVSFAQNFTWTNLETNQQEVVYDLRKNTG